MLNLSKLEARTYRLALAAVPVACILFVASVRAALSVDYKGELDLPTSLSTGDGIQLEKGKFDIEIRSEKGLKFLVFLRKGQIISVVNRQAADAQAQANKRPNQPMLGTVYLFPAGIPHEPEKDEKSSVTFVEHLKSRPWKAALRAYEYSDRQNPEVDFILEEESEPGRWSRTDFRLLRKK